MSVLLRLYATHELGGAGYPYAWHRVDLPAETMEFLAGTTDYGIKDIVRAAAGHRCIRCGHPYRNGEHGNGEWSPCDSECTHGPPTRHRVISEDEWRSSDEWLMPRPQFRRPDIEIEARWRILTVHHLDSDKANCRWWNLVALCQRCHLRIQGRVVMERAFILEHSEWFKPYAAGWYASKYLGQEVTREEAEERLEELLALERIA